MGKRCCKAAIMWIEMITTIWVISQGSHNRINVTPLKEVFALNYRGLFIFFTRVI